ncbi:hypothetical protein S83_066827, partial [Arachis hypogaea]
SRLLSFGVTINEEQAETGIVIIVISTAQSKFKVPLLIFQLLYFEQDANGVYGLALQIMSSWTGYKIYLKKDKRRNKKAKAANCIFCKNKADVGDSAMDDMAAIHFATQKGAFEVVKALVAVGASIKA